jgi:hypothetical protein
VADLSAGGYAWPEAAWEAAFDIWGAALYNDNWRTRKALDRRVLHAVRVWRDQHGPLTVAQEAYMGEVLAWCFRSASKDAAGERKNLSRYAIKNISWMVNHERVQEGFVRRSQLRIFDVDEALGGV